MTTPEQPEPATAAPAERMTRPDPPRTAPNRKPVTGVPPKTPSDGPVHDHGQAAHGGAGDPDMLSVNEAVASTVRSAYDVLHDTIAQGRKAAEQFRVGAYNVRDVPDDVRHMAGKLLGLARQLSHATFEICEALLHQTNGVMTPPPPGTTHVPPFPAARPEPAPPAAAAPPAPHPASNPAIDLTVMFNGKKTARAHTGSIARPEAPTAADDLACDGLSLRAGNAPPITDLAFEPHETGRGLIVMVTVPHDQPAGIYVGAIYSATQPVPLGQLVIEIE